MIKGILIVIFGLICLCFGIWYAMPRENVSVALTQPSLANIISEAKVAMGGKQESSPEELVEMSQEDMINYADFSLHIQTEALVIDAPVMPGLGAWSLARGVGHHQETSLPNPNRGNVVIAGHRWLLSNNPYHKIFQHLNKLRIGDDIRLEYQGSTFIYKVYDRKIVGPDALDILEDTDRPQLTIYTCAPIFTALKRLVYVAYLENVED